MLDPAIIFFSIKLEEIIQKEDIIVSGDCPSGADDLAEKYASDKMHKIIIYKLDWHQYGRAANMISNILNDVDLLVSFWDGKSVGTKDSINKTYH